MKDLCKRSMVQSALALVVFISTSIALAEVGPDFKGTISGSVEKLNCSAFGNDEMEVVRMSDSARSGGEFNTAITLRAVWVDASDVEHFAYFFVTKVRESSEFDHFTFEAVSKGGNQLRLDIYPGNDWSKLSRAVMKINSQTQYKDHFLCKLDIAG